MSFAHQGADRAQSTPRRSSTRSYTIDYGPVRGKLSLQRRDEKRRVEGMRLLAVKRHLRITMRALHAGVSVEEMQSRIVASLAYIAPPPSAPLPEPEIGGADTPDVKPRRAARPHISGQSKSALAIQPPVMPVKRVRKSRRIPKEVA